MKPSTINNFDLIRLFAATQVCLSHMTSSLGYDNSFFYSLSLFPGVPIFFFVSGFLIYGSYEKSKTHANPNFNFFTKRFFRLYPALWFCICISLLSIWHSGYFNNSEFKVSHLIIWIISQATVFQSYNPGFMKDYGVGVLNGSLWTISVEIQFYILTPFLFFLLNKLNLKILTMIFFVLIFINMSNIRLNETVDIYQKIFNVSFLPWLYMFFLGALFYKFNKLILLVRRLNLYLLFIAYVICYFCTKEFGWGNLINPAAYLILTTLIVKIAFSAPSLSQNILKNIDISYGVYLLHMPIINYLLHHNINGGKGVIIAMLATFILATFSWFIIEKRALSQKKNALREI